MEELKRIIEDAEIMQEDDALWPPPDRVGRQVCYCPLQFEWILFWFNRKEKPPAMTELLFIRAHSEKVIFYFLLLILCLF